MCRKGVSVLEGRIIRTMADGAEWTVQGLRAELGSTQQSLRGELIRLCEKGVVEIYDPLDPRERFVYRLVHRHRSGRETSYRNHFPDPSARPAPSDGATRHLLR